MADANHYTEAADGLAAAAKALRACGQEEADEQPTNLRDATAKARQEFARSRQQKRGNQKPSSQDDDG